MALADDLATLASYGIFNEERLSRLATMIKTVQALSGGAVDAPVARKRRGRPPKAQATMNGAAPPKKRGKRGSFNPPKGELAKMRKDGMTAKAIGAKYGVSMATVNLRMKQYGLTKSRKAKAAKKK